MVVASIVVFGVCLASNVYNLVTAHDNNKHGGKRKR